MTPDELREKVARALFEQHAPTTGEWNTPRWEDQGPYFRTKWYNAADAALADAARLREALRQIEGVLYADFLPSHGAIKYAARAALEKEPGDE